MCCCGKANINGQEGYSWDGKTFGVHKPHFAELEDGDELVRDLPGRCGGIDSHSYDFRIVKRYGCLFLLVHHGAGSERLILRGHGEAKNLVLNMSENDCYWMMLMVYHAQSEAAQKARALEGNKWYEAASEKRIKTRKERNSSRVKVWIEHKVTANV